MICYYMLLKIIKTKKYIYIYFQIFFEQKSTNYIKSIFGISNQLKDF